MKRLLTFFLCLILGAAAIGGCADQGDDNSGASGTSSQKGKVYALVAKDINNPYMQNMYSGFEDACNEIGVQALYRGPDQATPEKQISESISLCIVRLISSLHCQRAGHDAPLVEGDRRVPYDLVAFVPLAGQNYYIILLGG